MKRLLHFLFLTISVFFYGCNPLVDGPAEPIQDDPSDSVVNDVDTETTDISDELAIPILDEIEQKVYDATSRAFKTLDTKELHQLKADLVRIAIGGNPNNYRIQVYWNAYINYNLARFEALNNDMSTAKTLIDEGIGGLRAIEDKDVEEHALLSILLATRVRLDSENTFDSMVDARRHAEEALKLGPNNIRAALAVAVLAVEAMPGFGQIADAEVTIDQALLHEINESSSQEFSPTWGRPTLYVLKIFLLLSSGNRAEARSVLEEALGQYPNDYELEFVKSILP